MKITGPMSILCLGISSFAIFIVAAEDETPEDECIVGKQFPEGFGVEKSSVSPDGRYGVLVPLDFDHFDENEHENKLVEIKTGRSLAVIDGGTGKAGFLNHSGIAPSRWSSDGSYLLWKVYGKWSPRALVLLEINNGKLQWQRNLLKLMQQEILARTRKADAKSYAAAKKRNAGSAGDYYPEGFTIDVIAEGEAEAPLSLPLNLRAELTSNPKAIEDFPKDAEVNTELEASIDASGKLTVKNFK
jgi:hypothetical protein